MDHKLETKDLTTMPTTSATIENKHTQLVEANNDGPDFETTQDDIPAW